MADHPNVAAALARVKNVSSGGFVMKQDGRYLTGRAVKLLTACGYLIEVGWRHKWTEAGRAALRGSNDGSEG